MKYKITIWTNTGQSKEIIYEQQVDNLDIWKLIRIVNGKPVLNASSGWIRAPEGYQHPDLPNQTFKNLKEGIDELEKVCKTKLAVDDFSL